MNNLKEIQPLEDFNWESYADSAAVAETEKKEIEQAYDKTLNQVTSLTE